MAKGMYELFAVIEKRATAWTHRNNDARLESQPQPACSVMNSDKCARLCKRSPTLGRKLRVESMGRSPQNRFAHITVKCFAT